MAFSKKEFMEYARTYKLLIVLIIFAIFGLMNPIGAKLLPELMTSFMPEGTNITMPKPVAFDSWIQFYKNLGTALVVFVIVISGNLSNKITKGTLINSVTKGLDRKTIIFSKFTMLSLLWTASYIIYFGLTYAYTMMLLPSNDLPNIVLGALFAWLFGIFIISLTIFFGAMFKNTIGTLLGTGGVAIFLMLIGMIPNAFKFNPDSLLSKSLGLLNGTVSPLELIGALIITILLTIFSIFGAIGFFNKSKL